MYWALRKQDPESWLDACKLEDTTGLIEKNDTTFKTALDRYKYADRYPEFPQVYYLQQGEVFLLELEQCLQNRPFLHGEHFGLADAAILPFVRQFAAVDSAWFASSAYTLVQHWLKAFVSSALFNSAMGKYPVWQPEDTVLYFGPG
jgi:glutathione S-transferase